MPEFVRNNTSLLFKSVSVYIFSSDIRFTNRTFLMHGLIIFVDAFAETSVMIAGFSAALRKPYPTRAKLVEEIE
jgi:hypothetical protein